MPRHRPFMLLPAAFAASAVLLCGCAGGGGTSASGPSRQASAPASLAAAPPAGGAPAGGGRTGCALVSQAEVSAAVGTSLGAGHQAPYTPQSNIVAHSGCLFSKGTAALGYDLNTMASSLPVSSALATGLARVKAQGGKQISVAGNAGFSLTAGPLQLVTFFRGHTSVSVTATNAKAGAVLAVAKLIAARM